MNLKKIENPFGGLIYYKETTTSTMAEASAEVGNGNCHGALFIADYQSAGAGRIPGRTWIAESGKNLTFTLVLEKDFIGENFGTTPLKAGLALSKVISELTDKRAEVKWPNDVVVEGKKISGILCRMKKQFIQIGVGINVNQLEFDSTIADKTTSMSLLTNNGFNLEMVLSRFLNKLKDVLADEKWFEDLNTVLYQAGEKVKFAIGNPGNNNVIEGVLEGLDISGRVMIKDDKSITNGYLSGEFIL